eukprot:6210531-Pleurochrysis_carterae.AAC.2
MADLPARANAQCACGPFRLPACDAGTCALERNSARARQCPARDRDLMVAALDVPGPPFITKSLVAFASSDLSSERWKPCRSLRWLALHVATCV